MSTIVTDRMLVDHVNTIHFDVESGLIMLAGDRTKKSTISYT